MNRRLSEFFLVKCPISAVSSIFASRICFFPFICSIVVTFTYKIRVFVYCLQWLIFPLENNVICNICCSRLYEDLFTKVLIIPNQSGENIFRKRIYRKLVGFAFCITNVVPCSSFTTPSYPVHLALSCTMIQSV